MRRLGARKMLAFGCFSLTMGCSAIPTLGMLARGGAIGPAAVNAALCVAIAPCGVGFMNAMPNAMSMLSQARHGSQNTP